MSKLSLGFLAVLSAGTFQLGLPSMSHAAPTLNPSISMQYQSGNSYYPDLVEIETVFQKLFPRFRSSSGPLCSAAQATRSSTNAVYFYSSGDRPVIEIVVQPISETNAFALAKHSPWTKIFLTQGLLDRLESPSELAFVLAHEMAHVASEHSAPHGYTGFFTKSQLKKIADVHRKWEFEADMEALVTLKNAGYNGNAAAALLERFESDDVKVTVDYHRRHPSIQARVQLLRSTVSDPKADRFAWSR